MADQINLESLSQAQAIEYLKRKLAAGRPELAGQSFDLQQGQSYLPGFDVRGAMGSEAQADQRYWTQDVGRVGPGNALGNRAGYRALYNPDGSLRDVVYEQADSGNGADWFTNALLAAGTAAILGGAAGYGPLGGFSGSASAAAPTAAVAPAAQGGGYFGGLSAGAGGQTGLTLGAGGVTGATAPAGFVLAPEIGASLGAAGAGAAAADGGYFGGLDPAAGGQGLQMPGAASVEGMGGGQGLVATQAPSVAQTGVLGAGAAQVAPASVGLADTAKTLLTGSNLKTAAQLAGPAMSLISRPSMPQVPGAPAIPGAIAPPEARGLDRQAARSPILDVLGRNRRSNRNPTLLTGPGGVSMESVRVAANTLLGM